jgi:hypothetical protein
LAVFFAVHSLLVYAIYHTKFMKSNTKSENVQNISTQLIYISSAQQPHTASGYHVG